MTWLPVPPPAPRIETARLTLRALEPADWESLRRIATAPGVARMVFAVTEPWPRVEVERFIRRWRWQGRLGYRLAVCLKDGPMIGTVGIGRFPVETFYFLDPAHHGQGHATEAMAAFLADALARFRPETVTAEVFQDNPASARVLEKLGFARIGTGTRKSAARLEPFPVWRYRLVCAGFGTRP
jgi:RimJ/RimL family protein N-acetyltransferase